MEKPFNITFDLPVAHSTLTVPLTATVEEKAGQFFYVECFSFTKNTLSSLPLIPGVEIKYVKSGDAVSWVHAKEERESLLSQAIGKAIEQSGYFTPL